MQGSQEGKRAKLWGPRAHFGANISLNKIVVHIVSDKLPLQQWIFCLFIESRTPSIERVRVSIYFG